MQVVFSASYYIRDGATGTTCSDWANACDSLPATLQRGAIYYIADGTYGNYTFDDPVSGASLITVKKATASDHGTNTGWSSSYGDGQAIFTGSFQVKTDYLVIDGAVGGGPSSWNSGHGFVFTTPAGTSISYIDMNYDTVSNLVVRHVNFNQVGNTEATPERATAIYNAGYLNNSLFEYNSFDNLGGLPWLLRGGSGNIFQYNYVGNVCGMSIYDSANHCEVIVIHSMNDIHFRWNYIGDCPSTGGFVKNSTSATASDVRIYGNVFRHDRTGGGYPIQITGNALNWKIFNNTFNDTSGTIPVTSSTFTGHFYNNLFYDTTNLAKLRLTHGYNWFSKIASVSCTTDANSTENVCVDCNAGCDSVPETSDPFVNSNGSTLEDFRLTSSGNHSGYNVCSLDACTGENKYNIDALGNIRSSWSIGALEYGGSTPTPPPTGDTQAPSIPTNLTAQAVSQSQINLSWNASTDPSTSSGQVSGVAGYKVYRNGTQITTVTGTTYQNTGLSAGTTYAYTVSAYDAAGNNSAQSASVSATTQSATVTPPPTQKFQIGDRVQTTDKLNVRPQPNKGNTGHQQPGAMGTVIDGPVSAGDYIWWKIDYDLAPDGWSAENWLVKLDR